MYPALSRWCKDKQGWGPPQKHETIQVPACPHPWKKLRCLLELADQHKPLIRTSLAGRGQIPQRLAPPSSLMSLSRNCRFWTLTGSSSENCGAHFHFQSAITHTHALRGYHNTSLSQVPRSPYLMLPSWEPKEVVSLLFHPLG